MSSWALNRRFSILKSSFELKSFQETTKKLKEQKTKLREFQDKFKEVKFKFLAAKFKGNQFKDFENSFAPNGKVEETKATAFEKSISQKEERWANL